jgi:cysteine desulfurase / selenocysteine lyase
VAESATQPIQICSWWPVAPAPSVATAEGDRMSTEGIYLDNASTSAPKADVVWTAARDYLRDIGASPGRNTTRAGRRAHQVVDDARRTVADLLGVARASHIAFTANATHALNLAIHGVLRPGDHVVTTMTEHNSVLRPLERLARAGTISYSTVAPDRSGRFEMARFRRALRPETRMLVVNHASNVTGAVAPLPDIVHFAHECDLAVLVDAAQTAGLLPLAIDHLGIDMVAFTGHKWLGGPPGTGGLYIRDASRVDPLMQGGTGTSSHALVQPAAMPIKFEAGTLNYLGIAGLGAAVRLMTAADRSALLKATIALLDYCLQGLRRIPGTIVYEVDPEVPRVPVLSFNVAGLYPSELCAILDERYRISTRAGLHCAPLIHEVLDTSPHGTVRVSLGHSTTTEHVDILLAAVADIQHGKLT